MDNDEDFTFCPVGAAVDQGSLEAKILATEIDGIAIEDACDSTTSGDQNVGLLWKDRLPENASSRKEETVGTLSFSVIDTSSQKQSSELSRQVASSSAKNSPEQRVSARKPAPRSKVPFEKGYSQMDWLKLTRTHPDLAGLKGQSNKRLISMNEVKQSQTEGLMWTVLKGRVYNLYSYMKFHPGGVDMLMKAVGKDCTSLFNKYHAWVNAEFLLEKCLVGTLDDSL